MNAPDHHDSHDSHDSRTGDADDPFARRLRSRLDAEIWDLPEGGGVAAAVSRARTRRRNRRAVLASAAVLALVAGTSQVLTADPGEADLATAPRGVEVDESLTFDWTTTADGLSMVNRYSAGASGLYALSTAPGARDVDYPDGNAPRAMYRLADDGTWTPIRLGDDDPRVSTLSERGGVLYALSTGPASGAAGGPTGSVSTDGGESWSSVPLESPVPPSDAVAWNMYYTLDIASTSDRTLALVSAHVQLPYEDLFPEMFSDAADDAGYTTEESADGVHLIRIEGSHDVREPLARNGASGDPDVAGSSPTVDGSSQPSDSSEIGEVVRTVTWDELGIGGTDDLVSQRWAYAADGGEWNEVTAPSTGTTAHTESSRIETVGDRFLLTVEQHSETETTVGSFLSEDGHEWATITGPGAGRIFAAGDSLLHVGWEQRGDADLVHVSHDRGTSWTPIDLRSVDPGLEYSPDDHHVSATAGPLGVALLVHREDERQPLMLFSTDLTAWSVTDLADVVPDGGYAGNVLVGTDRVVVLGHTSEGEPGSPERSATLVGVPRRT